MAHTKQIREMFKWLWVASGGIRWRIVISCLLGLFRIVASLAFIYVSKNLIDMATKSIQHTDVTLEFISKGDYHSQMWLYSILLILLMLTQIAISVFGSYLSNQTQIIMKNNLQKKNFSHLIRARWSGIEMFHSGDIINRLEEDIRVITTSICDTAPNLLIAFVNLVAAFVFLCSMNVRLAVVTIIIIPFLLIFSKIYISKIRAITKHIRSWDSKIQSTIQESVQHRVLIQSMEKEEYMHDILSDEMEELYEQTMRRTRFTIFSRSMINLAFSGVYVAVFLYSVWQINSGIITFGVMTAFLQLVGQIQRPAHDLTRQIPQLVHASTSIDRLKELEEIPADSSDKEAMLEGSVGIRLKNITYRYPNGHRDILSDFSYDFPPGSRSAIMGETGSGKSTTIRLMLALLSPQKGNIEIYTKKANGDDDIVRIVSSQTRCNIAYVPQGNTLLSGTIRDNLRLGNNDADEQMLRKALHTAAADFVFDLPDGLDTLARESGIGLSEGQAQRIAIARGLLRPGSILILDEFSSSLDMETEKILIKRLIESYPEKTMIFITHREKIVKYCSNVVYLSRLPDTESSV